MNTEFLYRITSEIYFVLYVLCLTIVFVYFIWHLFHQKMARLIVGASFLVSLFILHWMPPIISSFTAYLIATTVALIVMMLIERGNNAAKWLYALLFFAIQWLLPSFFSFVQNYTVNAWLVTTTTPVFLALVWTVKYMLLFSCFFFLCKWLNHALTSIIIHVRSAITLSIPAAISLIIYYLLTELRDFTLPTKIEFVLALLYIGLACIIVFYVHVYANEQRTQIALTEQRLLYTQVELTTQHFQTIELLYEDLKGLKHDLTNHFEVVEALINQGHYEEAKYYTEKVRLQSATLDELITGHPVTDMILQQKTKRAQQYDVIIESSFSFPKQLNIEPFDLSIVLNNLLDNAIEASKHSPGHMIKIHCKRQHDLFLIRITNPIRQPVKIDPTTGLPISTKQTTFSGIGLQNVKTIVQKYDGQLQFAEHPDVFTVTALFIRPLHNHS